MGKAAKEERHQKRFIKGIIRMLLVGFLLTGILAAELFLGSVIHKSNYTLEVSEYTVTDKSFSEDIRMVVLADLHNQSFGMRNEKLVTLIQAQKPDLILCAGDFVVEEIEDRKVALELMKDLVEIAPVYFSMGNHEVHHQMNFASDFENEFESLGVHVLEYEYEDIEIKGQNLRLGGIYGYCLPESKEDNNRYNPKHTAFLNEFADTDLYTILLTHMPYTWLEQDGLEEWDINLTLCGHTHGGLIRIDGVGGLYAPLQGLFPGELSGVYKSEDASRAMLLTRGLGSSSFIPRINNVPEIMVVNLGGRD